MKEKIQVVLIALSNENRKIYYEMLQPFTDISLLSFSTLHQFQKNCKTEKFSGIIIDIRTLIRATSADKDFYSSLAQGFPILQVDLNQDKTDINCFIEGEKTSRLKGKKLWDHFFNRVCSQKGARGVRLKPRKNRFCNTFLYLAQNGSPVKTNLWDISTGGCFVISSDEKKVGDQIWLSIRELQDKTPICCQIRWSSPWGSNTEQLPGFGTFFQTISPHQQKEISKIVAHQ